MRELMSVKRRGPTEPNLLEVHVLMVFLDADAAGAGREGGGSSSIHSSWVRVSSINANVFVHIEVMHHPARA